MIGTQQKLNYMFKRNQRVPYNSYALLEVQTYTEAITPKTAVDSSKNCSTVIPPSENNTKKYLNP